MSCYAITSNKMKISVPIFFLLGNLICHVTTEEDWCALKCMPQKTPNIGCEFNGDCTTPNGSCKFVEFDHGKMVIAHNKLRSKFASGAESKVQGLEVANMMALTWDDDLAFLARCNLMKCESNMNHDECHITKKFKTAGQNIAWSLGLKDCITQAYQFVQSWYDEVQFATAGEIKQMGENFALKVETSDFTQVVWASTSHVGCALWSKDSDMISECMLTCNYGPAGNTLGGRMFKSGSAGSACPAGIEAYNGLCGAYAGYDKPFHLKTIVIVEMLIVLQIIYVLN